MGGLGMLFSKLGSLDSLLSDQDLRHYLCRGLKLLCELKQTGRLHANQDFTGWFEQALHSLP
jgi:hypothetical protein